MEFPKITERECPLDEGELPEQPESDSEPDCLDADFAAANPGLCPVSNRLILSPERVGICLENGTSLQLRAFLSSTTMTELVADVTYASSDSDVLDVTATGLVTAVGVGSATITATYTTLSLTARSTITVLSGETCCADLTVSHALLLDNSLSMGNAFDANYSTLLTAAKQLANGLLADFTAGVDSSLVFSFSTFATLRQEIEDIQPTEYGTNLWSAVEAVLDVLRQTTADRRLLVIFSDGANRPLLSLEDQEALVNACADFKAAGGYIMCVGLRAYGDGYKLLKLLASGGFFLNVKSDVATAISNLNTMRRMVCVPSCEQAAESNIVPVMMSATLPSGVVAASSDDGAGFEPFNAFDDNPLVDWQSGSATMPQWISYQFDNRRTVKAYTLTGSGAATTPQAWEFQGSNDGLTWTTLDTQDVTLTPGTASRHELATPAHYAYYRLYVTETATPANKVAVLRLELNACSVTGIAAQTADANPLDDPEETY